MQHFYAVIFSAIITLCLAALILYVDYGFWRERYHRGDEVVATPKEIVSQSPFEMMSDFFGEARVRFNNVEASGEEFLDGKEVFIREDGSVETSTQNEVSTTTSSR